MCEKQSDQKATTTQAASAHGVQRGHGGTKPQKLGGGPEAMRAAGAQRGGGKNPTRTLGHTNQSTTRRCTKTRGCKASSNPSSLWHQRISFDAHHSHRVRYMARIDHRDAELHHVLGTGLVWKRNQHGNTKRLPRDERSAVQL